MKTLARPRDKAEIVHRLRAVHPESARPVDFATDVALLETLLELVTAPTRSFDWQRHPIFGRMSDAAWLRWGYLHMDHHLRQFGA